MKSGSKRIILGLALGIGGIATVAVTLAGLVRGTSLVEQAKVPGTLQAKVEEAGRYYLWDNHWTIFEGERIQYPADCPADAKITVQDSTGQDLQFVPDSSEGWSIGNSGKTSIGYVDLPGSAELRIEVGAVGRDRVVSFSNTTVQDELWRKLGGFGVGILVGLIGLPIVIWGFIARLRRPRSKGTAT